MSYGDVRVNFDAPSPCLFPLVLAHLELLGKRTFPVEGKCKDRRAMQSSFPLTESSCLVAVLLLMH